MPTQNGDSSPFVRNLVAILGAIAGLVVAFNAYGPTIMKIIICPDFCLATKALAGALQTQPLPNVVNLRSLASTAYLAAKKPDEKCAVVQQLSDVGKSVVAQATPMSAYRDYSSLGCQDKLWPLAKEDLDAYIGLKAASDEPERVALVRRVVALGTPQNAVGWVYVGHRTAQGAFDEKFIAEPDVALNETVTLNCDFGFSLQQEPPTSTEGNTSPVVGFLFKGSRFQVLEMRTISQPVSTGIAKLVYAKAKVTTVVVAAARNRSASRRRLTRAMHPTVLPAVATIAAVSCPPFKPEKGSHGERQRWVFVGRKSNPTSATFLPGSSLLDSDCIPRDGKVVRAKKDLKVLVGSDPHSPGVKPTGQYVTAGSSIQVVGDISGYPYDATTNPDFCRHDPPYPHPSKAYDQVIGPGDRVEYCVYIPFNTI